MKTFRLVLSALLATGSLAVMSCADRSPVAPRASETAALADLTSPATGLLKRVGLLTCTPLPTAWGVKDIGPAGGVITVGPHTLTVPPGALSHKVTIVGVAPSGDVNHVQFLPEGLTFERSASLTMSYANCSLLGSLLPKRIAYTSRDLSKILYFLPSLDDVLGKKVTGKVEHFSDYAVAW